MGPVLLRGSHERGKEPAPWLGQSAEMEGTQSLREKHSSWTEEGKAERELHKPSVHDNLRSSGGGWALRRRLQRSVLGRELRLAMWRQTEGLGNSAPKAGKWSATAKGTWEEAWACRRSKALEERRRISLHTRGLSGSGTSLVQPHTSGCLFHKLQAAGCLLRGLQEGKWLVARLQVARHLRWGLRVAGHLLLQAAVEAGAVENLL